MPLVVVVVLVIGNILSNRVVPAAAYVPVNLITAALVFGLARQLVTSRAMGLENWSKGARWGSAVFLATLALYLVALVLPGFQDLFRDRRVDGGFGRVVFEAFVRIPLGTVLLEELAFRGALPALFATWMSTLRAVMIASFLFGLWHVLPSLRLAEVNPVFEWMLGSGFAGQLAGVAFAVFGTFLAGLWLCFLRYGSGSILAPVIAHISSNSVAFVIAWIAGGSVIQTDIMLRG